MKPAVGSSCVTVYTKITIKLWGLPTPMTHFKLYETQTQAKPNDLGNPDPELSNHSHRDFPLKPVTTNKYLEVA